MKTTYRKALTFLDSFLNLEKVAKPHSRIWNLQRMRELLEIFGHPEKGIFTVQIAGTKGKGSTGYFLSEILRQSGLRVGFYHSPHLEGPEERIWIGGNAISRKDFTEGLFKIQRKLRGSKSKTFTYFEIMTLLAALLFKEKKAEVAVYEVGMGGRLDATNTLPAKLTLITPIHFDHEAYLGDTLAEIAKEKTAILKPNRDVVAAPQVPEVRQVIQEVARRKRCPVWTPLSMNGARLRLLGDFQKLNSSMALRAASILRDRYHFPVTRVAMTRGIGSNHWPGRMEVFKGRPAILLDGAHNPKSIEALCRNLKRLFPQKRKILVFGTSSDKRSDRMIPQLAKVFKACILTQSNSSRAKEVASLLKEAKGSFPVLIPAPSPREALETAQKMAHPGDLIVITGSFYLIGELRPLCRASI